MSNTPAKAEQALATTKDQKLQRLPGAYSDAREINARLEYAAANFHLVSPASACGELPEGTAVALSMVKIDIPNETYDVGMGKVGLAKSALEKIAQAAGISWDARASGRMDDGSDPHYCAWKAVGRMRHLDGTIIDLCASKEMDLREGSPQVEALIAKAREKGKDATRQIREMRLHIMAHAESKARLRAIRSVGVRSSYLPAELQKPFAIARLMWTGRSSNPALAHEFAMKTAESFLGGARALYGDEPALPPGHQGFASAPPPPPVGTASFDEDDYVPEPPKSEPKAAPPPPKSEPRAATPPAARPKAGASGVIIAFGDAKGQPIEEADDDDLSKYRAGVARSVENPEKAQYRARNERDLAAIDAEFARRRGEVPPGEEPGDEKF